tara:strand:- start:210 stop:734 length:525 start_codon:yes stop_codon:yes gene_type:complete
MCLFNLWGKNKVINNQELELIEDRVKQVLTDRFLLIDDDQKNKKRNAFNKLKKNMLDKREEDNSKEDREEDGEEDICIICNSICKKMDINLIKINDITINCCNKCDLLSDDDIMLWFNRKQFNRKKDFEKTINVKNSNFVLVKYNDESIDEAIDNFIKSTGIGYNYHSKIKKII